MSTNNREMQCSGNLVPTKRGIALTEQQWDSLLSHKLDIEKLMDLIRSDKDKLTSSATEERDLFLVVYINKKASHQHSPRFLGTLNISVYTLKEVNIKNKIIQRP